MENKLIVSPSPHIHVEIFNLGTGRGVSVLELINTFEQATGVKVPHKIVGRREGDIEQVWANPERANKVLCWKAQETLADTLASAWKWQLKLREKGIMSKKHFIVNTNTLNFYFNAIVERSLISITPQSLHLFNQFMFSRILLPNPESFFQQLLRQIFLIHKMTFIIMHQ